MGTDLLNTTVERNADGLSPPWTEGFVAQKVEYLRRDVGHRHPRR